MAMTRAQIQKRHREKKMREDPEGERRKNADRMKRYFKEHPEKHEEKLRRLREKRSGCTQEIYDELLIEQDGKCAICGLPEKENRNGILHADHDHITGSMRGLLCNKCNTALGLLNDDPHRLKAARKYLRRWS